MSDVINVCVPVHTSGTVAVGTIHNYAFTVPSDAVGGGITITKWGICSDVAVGSGSAPTYDLAIGYNGTIGATGTIGANGAQALTAYKANDGTISTAFVDAGYDVFIVQKAAGIVATLTPQINVSIQYVMGK